MKHAFTLIELLVVVSIIVVLLTIMAAAMDKAIRQANLAKCGANLSAVTKGATAYAMENRGAYPSREAVKTDWGFLSILARDAGVPGGPNDDRPRMRRHIPMKALVDPLAGDISMEDTRTANGTVNVTSYIGAGGTETGTEVLLSNYALMFSVTFTLKGNASMPRMSRDLVIDGHSISVLVADFDGISQSGVNGRFTGSSHPDPEGRMQFLVNNNQGNLMWSEWAKTGAWEVPPRGPVDYNYAYKDGSVRRLTAVLWNDHDSVNGHRMIRVPRKSTTENDAATDYMQLPNEGGG